METPSFEQLGIFGGYVVFLYTIVKILWAKIEEKDKVIMQITEEHKIFSRESIKTVSDLGNGAKNAIENNTKVMEALPKTITDEVEKVLKGFVANAS